MSDAPNPVGDVAWSPTDPQAGILPTYSRIARRVAGGRARVHTRRSDADVQEDVVPDGARGNTPPSAETARREVSARELAEFLKSPFKAVMRYRFGIAIEGYRDTELELDSPLGIADGPVTWDLEGAWLEGEGDSDGPFRMLQLSVQAPRGFLGDFAKEKFDAGLVDAKQALLEFAASFGFDGKANSTSRQNLPVTIVRDRKTAVNVRYTSATPNWHEDGANVSVLVTGYLKDQNVKLPPERTLEPFLGFLMHVAKQDQGECAYTLRIGVISIGTGETACWRWTVTPSVARDYLDRLTLRYLAYLETPQGDEEYVDFTYKKLARAMAETHPGPEDDIDWEDVLSRVTAEDYNPGGGGFDTSLVVEQAVEKYRRDPSVGELKAIYAASYRLPLAGKKEGSGGDAAEGGAQ